MDLQQRPEMDSIPLERISVEEADDDAKAAVRQKGGTSGDQADMMRMGKRQARRRAPELNECWTRRARRREAWSEVSLADGENDG